MALPLFPLPVVLYPGQVLPLHIFEERYKRMIADCLLGDRTFGVLLAQEGVPPCVQTGTTARIASVQNLDAGRLNIETVGSSRFRVEQFYDALPYLSGDVTLLPDEEDRSGHTRRIQHENEELFRRYLVGLLGLYGRSAEDCRKIVNEFSLPDNPTVVAYVIAANLKIDLKKKQELLEAGSVAARLHREAILMRFEIELIKRSLGHLPDQRILHTLFNVN